MLKGFNHDRFKKTLEKVHQSSLQQLSQFNRKPFREYFCVGMEQAMEQKRVPSSCWGQNRKNLYHF